MNTAPLAYLLSGIIAFSFAGCVIPFPHTSERFPAMHGRVVDARTQQPVAEAVVALYDQPSTNTKTDEKGNFHFATYRNYHVGLKPNICATSWPVGIRWNATLDITHPGYKPLRLNALDYAIPQYNDAPYTLRDFLLLPTYQ